MATEKKAEPDRGRGKPPSRTRFKPGRSGNPGGRPRGSKNHVSALVELLNEEVPFKDGSMTRMEMFVRDLVDEAVAGKPKVVLCVERLMWEYDKDQPEFEVQVLARMRAAGIAELRRRDEELLAALQKRYAEPEKEKKTGDSGQDNRADVGKATDANSDVKTGEHKVGDANAPDEKVAGERANTEQNDAEERKANSNNQNRTVDVGAPEVNSDVRTGEQRVSDAKVPDEKVARERANAEQTNDGEKKTKTQASGTDGKAVGSQATSRSRPLNANGGSRKRTTAGRFLG